MRRDVRPTRARGARECAEPGPPGRPGGRKSGWVTAGLASRDVPVGPGSSLLRRHLPVTDTLSAAACSSFSRAGTGLSHGPFFTLSEGEFLNPPRNSESVQSVPSHFMCLA